jgi:hypothetical protein
VLEVLVVAAVVHGAEEPTMRLEFSGRSPRKNWCLTFELSKNGAENSKRIVHSTDAGAAVMNDRR